ncbi:MAG: hypothetical protein ACKOPS_26300 [Cyanobium sp.]
MTALADAGGAKAAIFTVGGQQYDVTTFVGSYTSDTSKFNTPSSGGVIPWWGNSGLAEDFAVAVFADFGTPNSSGSGPIFHIL